MCGIAGLIEPTGVKPEILAAMLAALHHRGPDDSGIEIMSYPEYQVGLAHARLSIIDLSMAAHQPMPNEDGTIWLSFNGEIYNFKELRQELENLGHRFESHSDSEVIIHGYEQYGRAIFKRLNGMFACAIWDGRHQELILARDRFGQKPLFFWHDEKRLVFASELKALLRHPAIAPDIDPVSLRRYLLCEYVPAPYCLIKNARKLEAGCLTSFKKSRVEHERYWDISFQPSTSFTSEHEAATGLKQKFRDAVERHLESDVPLGVFLSGGIDSSAIVACMSELRQPSKIKTFCIGFEESSFDESAHARRVARHFGTDHHEQILNPGKMIEILPEIWRFMDEPLADASIIPTYLLSTFTRQHVTVALGGDGGDELFCGYDPFVAHKLARAVNWLPGWLHRDLLAPLSERLPVSDKNMSFDFRLKQMLKGLTYPTPIRNQVWLGAFSLEEQKKLLNPDILRAAQADDPYAEIMAVDCRGNFRDLNDELVYLYCKYYLAGDILTKVDRASMACGLEVRAPFLDAELADFVNGLPSDLKMKGFTRKYLLKQILRESLPAEVIKRPKKGFGIPLAGWLKQDLRPLLQDELAPQKLSTDGLFRPEAVSTLIEDHIQGRRDNRKQLWTLLTYSLWSDSLKISQA